MAEQRNAIINTVGRSNLDHKRGSCPEVSRSSYRSCGPGYTWLRISTCKWWYCSWHGWKYLSVSLIHQIYFPCWVFQFFQLFLLKLNFSLAWIQMANRLCRTCLSNVLFYSSDIFVADMAGLYSPLYDYFVPRGIIF